MKKNDDLATLILKEILDTPFIKEINRTGIELVKESTPEKFIRTFIWQDIEFSLSLLEFLVIIIDIERKIYAELKKQLEDFPGQLKDELIKRFIKEADLSYIVDILQDKDRFGELIFEVTDTVMEKIPVTGVVWKMIKKRTVGKFSFSGGRKK